MALTDEEKKARHKVYGKLNTVKHTFWRAGIPVRTTSTEHLTNIELTLTLDEACELAEKFNRITEALDALMTEVDIHYTGGY